MKRLRRVLAALVALCECVVTYDEGEMFRWRNVDAERCARRGHRDAYEVVGLR